MPEEIVMLIVMVTAITSGTFIAITRMVLRHREKSMNPSSRYEGASSLTTSELERMLSRTVKREIDPIRRRLEAVEERVDVLPGSPERRQLMDADLETDEPARRRRARS